MADMRKNTAIRVYDRELRFQGEIDDYNSLVWTRKFFEPGEFDLEAPLTPDNIAYLKPGNILSKRGSREAAVIEDAENAQDPDRNVAIRRGRFLSSYFDRRLIRNTYNFTGLVETAMRNLITRATAIPRVTMAAARGFTDTVEFQATDKILLDYLVKLSRSSNIGFGLFPDFKNKTLVFETYMGIGRTRSNGGSGRVIFSDKFDNLNNAVYTYNDRRHKTLFVVAGEGEGSARVKVEVGGGSGLDLREGFLDRRDMRAEGITASAYKAALRQAGREGLAEHTVIEGVECETQPDINYVYKVDYDLGDVITVEKDAWGIRVDKKITEVMEIHEFGFMTIIPTLGNPLPEKIDWSDA